MGAFVIIGSIDLMDGQTVQLVGGRDKALEAGDPVPFAKVFGLVAEVAVVDLDAALGRGDNQALMASCLPHARCRVGGGIRSADSARQWLDMGASKVVLGTAAKPEVLRELPAERVVAALDARHGEVVVEGWQTGTGATVAARMQVLRPHVSGFLVTFVEREGRLGGVDLEEIKALKAAALGAELTIAGGVTTLEELRAIDAMGVHAQVGMALYTRRFDMADALAAVLKSDRPDGLWPTVVVDASGAALGLVYSDKASLRYAITHQVGAYYSRSRQGLWIKGATSGAIQTLLRVDADCDRDALRFTVRQASPGFCHTGVWTCWGQQEGIPAVSQRLAERVQKAPAGSYTRRLLDDPELLRKKLWEEAGELAAAQTPHEVAHEAADLLYFTMVALARVGTPWQQVVDVLQRRTLKVSRRPGDAKAPPPLPGESSPDTGSIP